MVVVTEPFRYSDDGIHALTLAAGKYRVEELSEVALEHARRHGLIVEDEVKNGDASEPVCNRGRTKAAGKNKRK